MIRLLFLIILTVTGVFAVIGATSGAGEQQSNDRIIESRDWLDLGEPAARDPELDAQIMTILEDYHIVGTAVTVFCTDHVYHQGYYGYAQLEDSIPVTELTTFNVASVSKVVTATAGLQVWEDVGVSLDADVADFFDFEIVHPTCPDTVMTFRHVYTHTAGLPGAPGYPGGQTLCEDMADLLDPDGEYYAPNGWYPYCPGDGFHYSNVGPNLMACFAAEHGGPTFPDYCQTNIFDPLGMDHTHWFGDECDPEHVAYGYGYNEDEDRFWVQSYGGVDWSDYPANGLRTTALDLTRHTMAIMQGGRLGDTRILEQSTVDEMLTVQFPEVDSEQGLMWYRFYCPTLQDSCWIHAGAVGGYCAVAMICDLDERDFGVVAINNGGGAQTIALYVTISATLQYISDNLDDCENSSVAAPAVPPHLKLHANHPNPFNPQTTISFSLGRAEWAEIGVYELTGRRVAVLANRTFTAGTHSLTWNGRDGAGRDMPSGTYLVRLETESGMEARKVTLLR